MATMELQSGSASKHCSSHSIDMIDQEKNVAVPFLQSEEAAALNQEDLVSAEIEFLLDL